MQRAVDRRRVIALAGAGAFCAGRAAAEIVTSTDLSPFRGLPGQPYSPPTNLRTVADIYRRMTAPVRVNGSGPYPFVIDTGANQSVISEELARRLSLVPGPPAPLNGVAGVEMVATTVATLDMGGAVRAGVTMSILPGAGIGGPGMIGLDGLENMRITLDFRWQALRIEAAGRLWPNVRDITVAARRRDGQLTLVDADLAGIPIVAFIDSGAQNTIGNMALRGRALKRRETASWIKIPILSATGQTIDAEMANLPELRVATLRLPSWPVAFADLHTFQMWNLTHQPAILLGIDVLSRFENVCIDFNRDEVRFRLPAST